ncbi:hypothetical protein [Nonomuraea jiangxiensis]|uniref:Multicopper oxidase n=1 Tax=Nonomuraea jiangxiensis TaxID=633440 RepID=A0A1G8N9J0_9ACTN|nr:hypothetical protein [Nonomuraea jiangxiensis]SDI76775.1 hypothetical protein SAMN05421869_10755 [Nonomuraea jiangxiensis]
MSAPYADFIPLLVLAAVVAAYLTGRSRGRSWPLKLLLVTGAGLWMALAGGSMWLMSHAIAERLPNAAVPTRHPCVGQKPRTFDVSLINVPLFVNRFGDVVPEGRMYVLDKNIAAVRATYTQAADPRRAAQRDLIEPLTLRANQGDCVVVHFTNRLNEPAPPLNKRIRNAAIFPLPGEKLRPAGTVTSKPREFAPARTVPEIDFDPRLAPNASMHFDGLDYDVKRSDGTVAGNNPDSTAPPGKTVTYSLHANTQGEFQFKDGADFTSQQTRPVDRNGNVRFIGSHAFGAFGAFVIEEPGAIWVDSRTGQPLESGTRAVIKRPEGVDFREHVLFMHDEVEAEPGILTRLCRAEDNAAPAGSECVRPTRAQLRLLTKGTLPGLGGGDADALVQGKIPIKLEWFAFNYRSEPGFNREEVGCPAARRAAQGFDAERCIGEETSLSSWAFGDPGGGDLVIANYRSEPTQVRLLHPAEFETHTFHWHVNRWMFDPADEGGIDAISRPTHRTTTTNILDVQAVSPGSHYPLVIQGGAGSSREDKPATFGDVIFHCHLYPHFANGMWGLNRTLDTLSNGTRKNPDGTPVPPLIPLPDHDYQPGVPGVQPPPAPTPTRPGFPGFVPGVFGFKAPKPPLGLAERSPGGVFPPTPLERAAADPGGQVPGAFFQDPCPADRPVKIFRVAAIQIRQQYNPELKWTNPQARVYVLQSDKQAVLNGKKPEPFAPILNVGDCVVYKFTNELPRVFGGTVFDRLQVTNEAGIHQHMVHFDVLSSDGAANGWNYDQGAGPGQTITYRDFVHENTTTNSFHDHFFPNVHQKNGLFGGSTIHPAGCVPVLPHARGRALIGTVFDVHCKPTVDYNNQRTDGVDYRNFSLFIEDHVPLFQPNDPRRRDDDKFETPFGVPIFPAKFPSSDDDQGGMGINYRLEPFEARRDKDPSVMFDSAVHGDPFTPLLRAYKGDPVKFRLFQLSQEESHGFNLDQFRWRFEPRDPESNVVGAQHIGMLEYFDVVPPPDEPPPPPTPDLEITDYQYNYAGADDWFLGDWGLLRLFSCSNPRSGRAPIAELPDFPRRNCTGEHDGRGRGLTDLAAARQVPHCRTGEDRTFDIVAMNKDITYNKSGDHDPQGLMYALAADERALREGKKQPEPLVIRANAGDCVTVNFTNKLDPRKMKPHCHEALEPGQLGFKENELRFPRCLQVPPRNEENVPGFRPFPVSAKASISPQLVQALPPKPVAPGRSIQYHWVVPRDVIGMALLRDHADVQNHLHHGLYGALIIEEPGSEYLNPVTGEPLSSGTSAVITHPTEPDFRENIVLMNSDLALFRKDGKPVPDNFDLVLQPSREADDPEDQGEFSINYRNEPWSHRFAVNQDITKIFSSAVHGDPATPLFQAYAGDRTVFRVGQAVGDPRSTSFALHGHTWRRAPTDPESQIAATQGQFNPGSVYNIVPGVVWDLVADPTSTGGAGGYRHVPGDYLYRSSTLPRHLNGGQWGLFRVHAALRPDLMPLPDGSMEGPEHEPARWEHPYLWFGAAGQGNRVSHGRRSG